MSSENIEKLSVREILKKVQGGLLDASILPKKQRQVCVEVLMLEGWLQSSIAELFKVSDRTISRDLKEIYAKNAIEATPELTKELVGELVLSARGHCSRIRQISRSQEISAIDKAKAEYLGWRVLRELVETLDTVGYLMAQKVPSKIAKKIQEKMNYDEETQKELDELRPMDRQKFIDNLTRKIIQLEDEESRRISENKPVENPKDIMVGTTEMSPVRELLQ